MANDFWLGARLVLRRSRLPLIRNTPQGLGQDEQGFFLIRAGHQVSLYALFLLNLSVFLTMKKIILASTSIYRKEQLKRLNLNFEAMSPNVDEEPLKQKGLDHVQLSRELSLRKAQSISEKNNDAIVIGGDQVASFNNLVLSKPKTKENAFKQLTSLAGNEHQLITSLAIMCNGQVYIHTCIAKMKMRQLTDEQIKGYIDVDEPLQCCGSYRIEAVGISLFEKIECEDYTSIIGIPLMWTAITLSKLGIPVP